MRPLYSTVFWLFFCASSLVLFPLAGIADIRTAAGPYANPLIFLFMGDSSSRWRCSAAALPSASPC